MCDPPRQAPTHRARNRDGAPAGRLTRGVPASLFSPPTPVLLGARPPGELHADALIASVEAHARAADAAEVAAWARDAGLTEAPAEVAGAVKEDVMDLAQARREILAYLEGLQVPGRPTGTLRFQPGGEPSLYAACDAAITRRVMGEDLQKTLGERRRREWIEVINSYAADDGTYRGGIHSLEHANGMVVGALGVLGGRQPHRVRLYDAFDTAAEVGPWLERIDWANQWGASHLFWGGMHCYSLSRECTPEWREAVFAWLDANLDPQTGWWRKGTPPRRPGQDPLGGGAHIWPIYQHHHRPFPYPRQVIDSILALQKEDGSWLGFANYLDLDALYGLTYMASQAPGYRADDIRRAAQRHGDLVMERYPRFLRGNPNAHTVLALASTLGLLQQLLPETFRDNVRWNDIFSDIGLYRTRDVETAE